MELKEKDLKLLAYFYYNDREPLTKIAKETGMTRIQVEHSLKKFIREGIIEKFITMFDYNAFGYSVYALMFIKLEKYSRFQKFTKKLEKSKNCISWGECFSKYDLFTNLIFKDEEDMSNFLSDMISEKNEQVLDYLIIKPYLTKFYSLKIFYDKDKSILPIVSDKSKEKRLSKKDLKILKILADDGRAKIVDIAINTGISAEMVLHKLKKFRKENIIFVSKAMVRMKKLGYNYSMILLNIRNLSQNIKEDLLKFGKNEKKVNSLTLSLFNPNCIIQIFHKTNDELKEEIKKIKELLKNEIIDLDVILAQEEDKINTLPFL